MKVWYQNRRTKHKRLINEDGHSSINDMDHPNESESLERIIKIDDEHSWNDEENHRQENSCSN